MIVMFFAPEATALWDVYYATTARTLEQHVHSFLEMIPLMGIVCIVSLHWEQFLVLLGVGNEWPQFALTWKREQPPLAYIGSIMSVTLLELLPYLDELWRGLRANAGRLVPEKALNSRAQQTTVR